MQNSSVKAGLVHGADSSTSYTLTEMDKAIIGEILISATPTDDQVKYFKLLIDKLPKDSNGNCIEGEDTRIISRIIAQNDHISFFKNAIDHNQLDLLKNLMKLSEDLRIKYPTTFNLSCAISNNNYEAVVHIFETLDTANMEDTSSTTKEDILSMHHLNLAAKIGNYEIFEYLFNKNKDLIYSAKNGTENPLHYAADYGENGIIELILKNNPNPDFLYTRTSRRKTALSLK